jgi:hypothetical protein
MGMVYKEASSENSTPRDAAFFIQIQTLCQKRPSALVSIMLFAACGVEFRVVALQDTAF